MDTAVLFETFARPQYARQVFDQIKKAKPKKLYFYSNKARVDRPDEVRNNEEIRSWVKEVDRDCELHTFFREEYVDVYTSVRSAMDWVFENEEQAIVLEDDCVPSVAFFEFCDFFLDKYKDDKSVAFLSGNNYAKKYQRKEGIDHIYADFFSFFGFASWRNRWQEVNFHITVDEVMSKGYFETYFFNQKNTYFFKDRFTVVADFIDKTHVWDYVLSLNCIKNKWYGVYPITNLVRNIGVVGCHSNESVLRLVDYIEQSDHYPFTPQHIGEKDVCFEKQMLKKTIGKRPVKNIMKNVSKAFLGEKTYCKIKKFVKYVIENR